MVGLRRAKTLLFVVLVIMATTIANGAKLLQEKDKDESKGGGETIDVKASGAKGDGKTDDSKAFADAWKKACESKSPTKIKVQEGKYLVQTLEFKGPCKSAVTFEMDGHIIAPSKATPGKPHCGWINFEKLENFNLNGHGAIFDGQGAHAWKINDCAKTGKCNTLPINIRITSLTNSKIKGIKSTNSKLFHMNIINCKNLTLEDIGIDAPPESLNTDGIHIGRSDGVRLVRAKIKTGDDCISIGDGTENFLVENVECGPGHGIAIGSLGKYPNEKPVRGVTIRRSLIKNTDNGVRIKTWPGSPPGIVSNILFQDITMDNVSLPILIDQVYCPHGHCKKGGPSKVKLSDITYRDIKGTSASKIIAPAESPNTDGIHSGRCEGVKILNTKISTGDDCISVGDGMKNLLIEKVVCGPGHGISVGSLGRYGWEQDVNDIKVINCTLEGTDNGLRIKTWPSAACTTTAAGIHFEDIILNNLSNPILIDQEYCPWNQCNKNKPSTIKLVDITFTKIRGTSGNKDADIHVRTLRLETLNIEYKGADGPPTFECTNVTPKLVGTQNPKACVGPVVKAPGQA
ncbi:ExopolygalacturonaseGBGA483 [Hirschfeldia incana]|nr:ExopolygalacturonaseGBGA483 [Hirschfeldia incana]